MGMGDEQDFERYVEERYLQKQYQQVEEQVGSHESNSEIEDEDFSKLSLADPNSDSEELFLSERDINPWAKEDKFKKPPKYAIDSRQLFNDAQSIVNPPNERDNREILEDENMTDSADKTGENQIIDKNIVSSDLPLQDIISNESDKREIIPETLLPNFEQQNLIDYKKEIVESSNIEKKTLSRLHWIGITSFMVAVISVLVITFLDIYQTAKHG
ncbi:predicted protein [Naegleria gruberi]|uniref:Predicted protein n=1 Tax=Naegleria gruberi TaxID=5762 RepID=D2UXI6_NAEGR|nr:uncharacterized protein NAEGRDRAFT_61137 [Naegleria gruberi]EFC50292.1 predicted protein [Naegleria gruberi]|eukprot:XP_002683036.1 predicted protein [Naegleria gruberi strain NEG-M]